MLAPGDQPKPIDSALGCASVTYFEHTHVGPSDKIEPPFVLATANLPLVLRLLPIVVPYIILGILVFFVY